MGGREREREGWSDIHKRERETERKGREIDGGKDRMERRG